MIRDVKIGSRYKHFKGNEYLVICIAKDSENTEDVVVYKEIKSDKVWVRPVENFLETVNRNGMVINRFEEIE